MFIIYYYKIIIISKNCREWYDICRELIIEIVAIIRKICYNIQVRYREIKLTGGSL